MTSVRLLVLGNGAAGAEKQALALAARLRDRLLDRFDGALAVASVECVRVALGRARLLPPVLHVVGARLTRNPLFGYMESDAARRIQVQKPPRGLDVVIGCGRSTVALCAVLKQLDAAGTFNVQIQHPRVPFSWFDAVVAPRHDFRGGDVAANVFLTSGTVCDVTSSLLEQQEELWRKELDEELKGRRTRVVWLLGGPCRGFQFTVQDAERMVEEFVHTIPPHVAVLVTFSRRTPKDVQHAVRRGLASSFREPGQLMVWNGTEKRNPYYALLSTASCIVTTPDSISMTTEAITSGKPVFTISAEHSKGKFQRFHQSMIQSKATAPFTRDTVATALQQTAKVPSAASIALEKEISTIADAVASNIHEAIKTIESS